MSRRTVDSAPWASTQIPSGVASVPSTAIGATMGNAQRGRASTTTTSDKTVLSTIEVATARLHLDQQRRQRREDDGEPETDGALVKAPRTRSPRSGRAGPDR
jgi:hypothetical protein